MRITYFLSKKDSSFFQKEKKGSQKKLKSKDSISYLRTLKKDSE